jgi:hypothetical protein
MLKRASYMLLGAVFSTAATADIPDLSGKNKYDLIEKNNLTEVNGYKSTFDPSLGSTTFHWIKNDSAIIATSKIKVSPKNAIDVENLARNSIEAQGAFIGVASMDSANAKLLDIHDNGRGPVIVRFQQMHQGKEVFGQVLSLMLDRQYQPKAISGYFAPTTKLNKAAAATNSVASAQATSSKLSETKAAQIAYQHMTSEPLKGKLSSKGSQHNYNLLTADTAANSWKLKDEVRVKSLYFRNTEKNSALVPAYLVELHAIEAKTGERKAFSYLISAETGKVLIENNQISHADVSYRVWADPDTKHPLDGPRGNDLLPSTARLPQNAPAKDSADDQLVTLSHGPISTRDPWLKEGVTETWGNNVIAYLDIANLDGFDRHQGDMIPEMTAPGVFDYQGDALGIPSTENARKSSTVNLFYLINWLHDDWYDNGLDEASGNAQMDNYGRGGLGGDPIFAEAQDWSGRNNANMYTPGDGKSPVMQMYLWDGVIDGEVTVLAPANVGPFVIGGANYGPTGFDVEADVVLVNDGIEAPFDGCEGPLANADEISGKIALVLRGNCDFIQKTYYAEQAGALAVLVVDNVMSDKPPHLGGDNPSAKIPTASLTANDGGQLMGILFSNQQARVRLRRANTDIDGTVDFSIVAHEFFHYVSNRLIGDGSGLNYSTQGKAMGEGWSDFAALMMSVREDDRLVAGNDKYQGPYGMGMHITDNTYLGLRRAPYSTDMSVYPMTFKHMVNGVPLPDTAPISYGQDGADNSEIHASGEIWANTLWEFYASLLNDPRYSFEQAKERMQDYLIASLKMTPVQPTFLEARDALLAVTQATDTKDWELAAKAFAKRGMGVGAEAPDRYSLVFDGIKESFEAIAASYKVVETKIDYNYDNGSLGYCSKDGIIDADETFKLSIKLQSTGTESMSQPITAKLLSNAKFSFPENDTLTFPTPDPATGETSASILVTLNETSTAEKVQLELQFDDYLDDSIKVIKPAPVQITEYVNFDPVKETYSDDMQNPSLSRVQWQIESTSINPMQGWQVIQLDDQNQVWHGPDNNRFGAISLTTPEIEVSTYESFVLNFNHWFSFEPHPEYPQLGLDAGLIQISVNGSPFSNITDFGVYPYNGYYNRTFEAAFVGRLNDSKSLEPVQIDFGTSLAGSKVRLRFVSASDAFSGDIGWLIDNVAVTGAETAPFMAVTTNSTACDNRPLYLQMGPDMQVLEHDTKGVHPMVQLGAEVLDRDGLGTVSAQWVQVAGPKVELSDQYSLTPTFKTPVVSSNTLLSFRLSVSQGANAVEDTIDVTVLDAPAVIPEAPAPQPTPDSSGGAVSPLWLIAGLWFWVRRRLQVTAACYYRNNNKNKLAI